jgi:hypothetical protein
VSDTVTEVTWSAVQIAPVTVYIPTLLKLRVLAVVMFEMLKTLPRAVNSVVILSGDLRVVVLGRNMMPLYGTMILAVLLE